MTAVAAIVVENKRPSGGEFAALCILTGGVCIAVWENTSQSSSLMGTVLCILGGWRSLCQLPPRSLAHRLTSSVPPPDCCPPASAGTVSKSHD